MARGEGSGPQEGEGGSGLSPEAGGWGDVLGRRESWALV